MAASARTMAVVAGHHSSIAVVHGRGINPVLILSLAARAGALAMMVGWTATAPPSSSSSATSSATGGSSWSCVHNPLKLPCGVPTLSTSEKYPRGVCFKYRTCLALIRFLPGRGFAIPCQRKASVRTAAFRASELTPNAALDHESRTRMKLARNEL